MNQQLEELLKSCTVKISIPDQGGWGTGFFVAPGLILTCAHVVRKAVDKQVNIFWPFQNQDLSATVKKMFDDGKTLDIALLTLAEPWPNHPCVLLDEASVAIGQKLYSYGYLKSYSNAAPVYSTNEGLTGDIPPLLKFQAGQIEAGLSGAALIDLNTDKVCGMVKETRDPNLDMGGGAVPTQVILEKIPWLKELQQQFHQQDDRWTSLLFDRGSALAETPLEISWHEVSLQLLEEQERLSLTTNPMTRDEDIAYQVDQVYVPLGLVERKKVPRRKADVSPERGSELYWEGREQGRSKQELNQGLKDRKRLRQESDRELEVEVTQRFEHKQFLEQVLHQGQSSKSQGKRIAIIGEPGAGKTTQLQQIARWISKTFPQSVIIWVQLKELGQKKLKQYLDETWLTSVVEKYGQGQVSERVKNAFVAQFNKEQVWLLLDGADEMQVTSGGNALSEIEKQRKAEELLREARIVLTCRLNLWDQNRNALVTFDTYRTLEFTYPGQVEQFIGQWFAPRGDAAIQQGQELCRAMKEPGNERIRDLVKNPLRLTLLCYSWLVRQGRLPDTQAELYELFVERFYEWKTDEFPTTWEQQQELNRVLAQLSKAAIDDRDELGKARFLLRHEFVVQSFERQEKLFNLALQLGWLNKVGVDADGKEVYAFYHTTFEEYFAALAIQHWRFFLNHIPRSPGDSRASYRIFDPQWRQVFLLWLGRQDKELEPQKEDLIQALVKFKDGCKGFYSDRAFLLAAEGIAEFKDCTQADEIINQLIQWAARTYNWLKFALVFLFDRTRVEFRSNWAISALSSTDSQQAIGALVRVLETTQNLETLSRVADILRKIGRGNETAIRELVRVLEKPTFWSAAWPMSAALMADNILREIGRGNETAIRELVRVLETTQDEDTRWSVAVSLGEIDPGNETAIQELVRVLETTQDEDTRWGVAGSLGNIDPGNETAIRELVQVLQTTQQTTQLPALRFSVLYGTGKETAIGVLVQVLETTQDEDTRWRTAYALAEIGRGNETAIGVLVQVLETTQNPDNRLRVAESLGKIDPGNETAIRELVRVLETTQNLETLLRVAESLGKIDPGNETAIRALVRLLETSQDQDIRISAAKSLVKIDPGNETAIRVLVRSLRRHLRTEEAYQLMVKCAETLPYPEFYRAFHSSR